MTLAGTFVVIASILLWTVVREALLEKFAYAKHPNALRNSGLIVAGTFIATLVIMLIAL